MSLLNKSILLSIFQSPSFCNATKYFGQPVGFSQVRYYAARKGYREQKKKQKVKVEEKKVGFIPHNQRNKEKFLAMRPKRKFDDSWKQMPLDDVYVQKYYKWTVYPFAEAVECHRETHHPEMYNKPNANLHVSIELNMEGEKKNKFVDNFTRTVAMPHKFDHGEERSIVAFTKIPEMQEEARQAGAQLAGGVELIKQIQEGTISLQDFHVAIAHPAILPELVVLRGLMKKKFPNIKNGTLDVNVVENVVRYFSGINYTAAKDEYEKDFGLIETVIGTLDMAPKNLEDNFAALIKDVYSVKPKRKGIFINRCLLWSPPSPEKLKIDHNIYLQSVEEKQQSDDEGEELAVAA